MRARSQFGGDIVELHFQRGGFAMAQSFAAQAPEIMLEKEIQFPGELGFIEGQTAGD